MRYSPIAGRSHQLGVFRQHAAFDAQLSPLLERAHDGVVEHYGKVPRKAAGAPSAQTDLYSLAVLLFYILLVSHPLEGAREASIKCFDRPAMDKLYGTEPLFIYDPQDDSNRPVPQYHDNAIAFYRLA